MTLSLQQINILDNLVGRFSQPQLQNLQENLEFCLHPDLSVFVPVFKFCEFAALPNHSHPGYSFIYNIKMKGHLLMDGKKINPPDERAPNICAFSPGVSHQEIMENGFSNYYAIFIRKEYFEKELSHYIDITNFKLEGTFFPKNSNMLSLLKLLVLEHQEKQIGSKEIIGSLNHLITNIIARIVTENPHKKVVSQNKIDSAINFMCQNIDSKITVQRLAEEVNLSVSHFTKLFKEITSQTPVEYLNHLRLEKAKRLLKFSQKNLTEVAFDCGFTSSSYFSYLFIDREGLSPSQYRMKFTQKENI